MNSLVLKQASPQLEWYYSAVKPCVHYLPFWQRNESDVLQVGAEGSGGPCCCAWSGCMLYLPDTDTPRTPCTPRTPQVLQGLRSGGGAAAAVAQRLAANGQAFAAAMPQP